ncbi:START domain protein [Cryptosporidium felis]|nr:START domain protein [Cryptosporidium felis]
MWNIWNGSESTKSNTEKAEKHVPKVSEAALSSNTTRSASNSSISAAKSNVMSNGAIIGERFEHVTPKTEREKSLFQEYNQKLHGTLSELFGVIEDFVTAQENESNFKALGSCQKSGLVHVNLGSMGEAKCSRFDSSSSSSKLEDNLSTYVARCSFGTSLTPRQVFDFLLNIENKPLYDSTCAESSMILHLGHLVFARQCYRGMMGVQGREFLIVGRNYTLSDDCFALVASSVTDSKKLFESEEELPVADTYVRGEIKLVGFLIRKSGKETELFFAQRMDLGGAVPLMLQRIVLATQLQSLNTLKKHLLDNFNTYYAEGEDENQHQQTDPSS